MGANVIAPRRGDSFSEPRTGVPLPRAQVWIEEVTRLINTNNSTIGETLDDHESRIANSESSIADLESSDSALLAIVSQMSKELSNGAELVAHLLAENSDLRASLDESDKAIQNNLNLILSL